MENLCGKIKMVKSAGGITHKYNLNSDTYFKTSLAATYSDNHQRVELHTSPSSSSYRPVVNMKNTNLDIVLNSYFNKKYSARHTNRSGITVTGLLYNLDFSLSPNMGQNKPMQRIVKGNSEAMVVSAHGNSVFKLTDQLTANVGVNTQFLLFSLHSEQSLASFVFNRNINIITNEYYARYQQR